MTPVKLPRGLIVSCQACADNPLHGPPFMVAMAQAAQQGGGVAIRAEGLADVAAICAAVPLPVIGLIKRDGRADGVYITPEGDASAVILCIDMGASSSKWALFTQGRMTASGVGAPLSGHLYTPGARQRMADGLPEIRAAVPARPSAVVVGVTGLQADFVPLIEEMLSSTFHLPQTALRVTDDLHLAHAAHFPVGGGTLVYAGTGSMAYHRTAAGEVLRAGGHGFLIDDAGGAFWQGRQGLKAVLRGADGGGTGGFLASRLYGVIGSEHWPAIRAYVYGGGRAALARLAPAVYAAAAVDGDAQAHGIQRRAGQELAHLGRVVLARSGGRELALCGGSFNPLVTAAFHEQFKGLDVTFAPTVSPLLGGLALAPA